MSFYLPHSIALMRTISVKTQFRHPLCGDTEVDFLFQKVRFLFKEADLRSLRGCQ